MCDGLCGCLPDWAPCPHFKAHYLCWQAQELIKELLEYPRPLAHRPSFVRRPDAMAVVMEGRAARGECLWHPQDAIQIGMDDRINRQVSRMRNGTAVAGTIGLDDQLGAGA